MPQPFDPPNAGMAPVFLADHPVLDFLNTVAVVEGRPVDFLQSDEDVLRWLKQAGFTEEGAPKLTGAMLLAAARKLREAVRGLVAKRKVGSRADASVFNAFLAKTGSYPQLVWEGRKPPRVERVREQKSPEQMLARLADSAADLLTNGDFDLIRECEDDSCVLWFYDRTKSHRRRWCSMAACGNRNKVKAFRQRQLA